MREAAYRICDDEDVIGAMGLVNHLVKVGFVKGLSNKIIQTIVRSKGETAFLSTFTDTALEEESTIYLLEREREREGGVLGKERLWKHNSRASPSISTTKQWR